MELASFFSFPEQGVPLVHSAVTAEAGELGLTLGDAVILEDFFVPHVEENVVAKVLDFEVLRVGEASPVGVLAAVVVDGALPLLFTQLNNNVRVHLADSLRIVSELRLNKVKSHSS